MKLVRVLANLSIHEEVGPLVARSSVFASLIEILGGYCCSTRLLYRGSSGVNRVGSQVIYESYTQANSVTLRMQRGLTKWNFCWTLWAPSPICRSTPRKQTTPVHPRFATSPGRSEQHTRTHYFNTINRVSRQDRVRISKRLVSLLMHKHEDMVGTNICPHSWQMWQICDTWLWFCRTRLLRQHGHAIHSPCWNLTKFVCNPLYSYSPRPTRLPPQTNVGAREPARSWDIFAGSRREWVPHVWTCFMQWNPMLLWENKDIHNQRAYTLLSPLLWACWAMHVDCRSEN